MPAMNPPSSSLSNAERGVGAETRSDQRQRDIVNQGIALMRTAGTLPALEYLKSHAVGGRVIARVLLDPVRRRGRPEAVAA